MVRGQAVEDMTYITFTLSIHHQQLRAVQESYGFLTTLFLAEVFLLGTSFLRELVVASKPQC
jgi:hypothetical protein